jgi:hypothetical protein
MPPKRLPALDNASEGVVVIACVMDGIRRYLR